jgi:hypothetical protein
VDVYQDGTRIGSLPLDSLLAALRSESRGSGRGAPVPAERLRLTRDSAGLRVTLQLSSVGGQWENDSLVVREFAGVVLVGRR